MNQELFVKERTTEWDNFNYILKNLESQGIASLSSKELEQFIFLYREITGDLMYAKSHGFDPKIVSYLNSMVAKGHPYLYSPPPGTGTNLRKFFLIEFPRLVNRYVKQFLLAAIVFFAGFLFSYVYILFSPDNAELFVPEDLINIIHERLKEDTQTGWAASPKASAATHPLISSYIMTNNIKVGFFSFAYGIFLGLGTALILFQNGVFVGAVAGIYGSYHLNSRFWALVLPHGVTEFVAIFICAQAGFLIGSALINPGKYKRQDAIILAGNTAIRLVLGTIPLFGIAAIIEGFITPLSFSDWVKLGFAFISAVFLWLYFNRARDAHEV